MKPADAIRCLSALAQETRLSVYRLLVRQGPGGMAAGEIAAALDLAPTTLSFHLKELANAGLLTARQAGRFVFYSADFAAMNALLAFLTENCCTADSRGFPAAPSCASAGRAGPVRRAAAATTKGASG